MSKYVDVYVLPVPKDKVEAYRRLAADAGKVWREHGALEYIEVVGDDVKAGVLTSFPQAVKLADDETVVVGWIVYASRAERDRVNADVMKDPRIAGMDPKSMPFDSRRMFWGGFERLVELLSMPVTLRPAGTADLPVLRHWDGKPHVVAASEDDAFDWERELPRTVAWRELLIAEVDGRPIGMMQIIDPAEKAEEEETHRAPAKRRALPSPP